MICRPLSGSQILYFAHWDRSTTSVAAIEHLSSAIRSRRRSAVRLAAARSSISFTGTVQRPPSPP